MGYPPAGNHQGREIPGTAVIPALRRHFLILCGNTLDLRGEIRL